MVNKLTFFSLLVIYMTLSKINSQELCQSFTYYGYFIEEQDCPAYCCGDSCSDRYCCNDVSERLDQTKCTPENCTAYYDYSNSYQLGVNCHGEFCCGSCQARYCCTDISSKLNQSECSTLPPITTTPFYSSSSTSIRSSSTTSRIRTTTYNIQEDSITAIVWIMGSIGILSTICFALAMCVVIAKKKKTYYNSYNNATIRLEHRGERRQQPDNIYNSGNYNRSSGYPQNYTQPRPAFTVGDNSAYNYDMNRINNTNVNVSDDLPPSYETVLVKQKNDETVETNV